MTHPDIEHAPRWKEMSGAAGLIGGDGQIRQTVFGEMTELAVTHGAVNLGQGAPSLPTPDFLIDDAADAMRSQANQYPPPQGHPELRAAIAAERTRRFGRPVSADQVLVTVGATEALTAAIVALVPAGGTLLTFEPYYDSYAAAAALAGARLQTVPLVPDADAFAPDWDEFDRQMSSDVDAVLVNSPHNPTGVVLGEEELRRIFARARQHDAWIITDEVYEHLVFEPWRHVPMAAVVEDPDRIITISSAGKTFNATGWKIGWLIAVPAVVKAVQAVKQYLTFASGHPQQIAFARAIESHREFPEQNRDALAENRTVLLEALHSVAGLRVFEPAAGYFAIADFSAVSTLDAYALNELLTRDFGFTGIPVAGLCRADSPTAGALSQSIRYSFCKTAEEMAAAAQAIVGYAQSLHP